MERDAQARTSAETVPDNGAEDRNLTEAGGSLPPDWLVADLERGLADIRLGRYEPADLVLGRIVNRLDAARTHRDRTR